MHRFRVLGSLCLGLSAAGCLSARFANIDNLDVPLPASVESAGWRADMSELLDRYERAPVLAAEDERLEPLLGGLATLSYFGADAKLRVAAQQITPGQRAPGRSLAQACVPDHVPAEDRALATIEAPVFIPMWIPLARAGQQPAATWRCDERGQANAAESFCMFGRLAVRPEAGRPLIVLVHGIFDSGAQEYMQRMAAQLFSQGYSLLLPDMRDHGETLRAAPEIATTLGTLEGADLLAAVAAVRSACGARVGRVGALGISAGGLDAIRAFTLDRAHSLDAGVIAMSPLLDVRAAIEDLSATGPCPITRSIELSWVDDLTIAAASGAAFFGGAAIAQALNGHAIDATSAWTGAIGVGVGLLGALAVDAWFDGGSAPCISEHAIAMLAEDALRVRWRALQQPELGETMSRAGRRIEPDAIQIGGYLRERAGFLAKRVSADVGRFDAVGLARDLQRELARGRTSARLLVVGAADDPLSRSAAQRAFVERVADLQQVYARTVSRGGHGAMWLVQPTVTEALVARFFGR